MPDEYRFALDGPPRLPFFASCVAFSAFCRKPGAPASHCAYIRAGAGQRCAGVAAVRAGRVLPGARAHLLGRCSRTPRTFVALFLFGLYVAVNVTMLPMIDAVGFNGAANGRSVLAYLGIGMVALVGGYVWNRRG